MDFLDNKGLDQGFEAHPMFPHLPTTTPLTYLLTMMACLSEKPADRPTFAQLLILIADMDEEVQRGSYIDASGRSQARPHLRLERRSERCTCVSSRDTHTVRAALLWLHCCGNVAVATLLWL